MNIPQHLYNNFISNEDILCIIGEDEHKIFIEKEFIEKNDNLVSISIHQEDENGVNIELLEKTYGINNFLKIAFWDLPCESTFDEINNIMYYGLNFEKAQIIVDFIVLNLNKQFVINCSAGISRSAAIGMAILCIKHFDGNIYDFNTSYNNPIKNHWRYKYNKFVFNKLIEIYNKKKT